MGFFVKIAVIGGGAAGMAAAWGLNSKHDVTVYEKATQIGGHVNSITTKDFDSNFAIDNGFMVFNFETYPILTALLKRFDLKPSRVKMSVLISGGNTFTICEDIKQVILANKFWLLDPRVYILLFNIIRFHSSAKHDLKNDNIPDLTIIEYLKARRYSARFYENFLGPVASAIWVGSPDTVAQVPAKSFIRFFEHHNMLGFRKFKWFHIKGGSIQYIDALASELKNKPLKDCAAKKVIRNSKGVVVEDTKGNTKTYDQIIFACHPDEILSTLADPSEAEASNLAAFNFIDNDCYCHNDQSIMPPRKSAWMSWNCHYSDDNQTGKQKLTISYYHNSLMKMDRSNPVFLTMDPPKKPKAELTIKHYKWSHIQFDKQAIEAQKQISAIQGKNRTWFAGAWLGYGFNEDALGSGITVARELGCELSGLPEWQQPDW